MSDLRTFLLKDLPVDILRLFCDYLGVSSIFRLLMTGDKRIQRQLGVKGVVLSLKINSRDVGVKPFPSCLEYLPFLSKLWLRLMENTVYGIEGFEFGKIPKAVEELWIYSFGISNLLTAHGSPNSGLEPLYEILPNLRRLSLPYNWVEKENGYLRKSLFRLEFLGIVSWDVESALPPNLTGLSAATIKGNINNAPEIPKSLTELCIPSKLEIPTFSFLSRLPPTLRRLIGGFSQTTQDIDIGKLLNEMFPELTMLFSGSEIFNHSIWPPSLTDLGIPLLKHDSWSLLPHTLQKIRFSQTDEVWSEIYGLYPISALPRNLTYLKIQDTVAMVVPKRLEWPKTLTLLKISTLEFLDSSSISGLPSGLLKFSCSYLNGNLVKQLPRGLRSISADCIRLESEFIENLPPFLTKLSGDCDTPENIGTFLLDYHYTEEDAVKDSIALFERKPMFPKSLTVLKLYMLKYMTDSIVVLLHSPIMHTLIRRDDRNIQNSEISLFPSMLVILILNSALHLTGDCFKWLPRSLTYLDLSESYEVRDDHISDLPPNLLYLWLSSALHLTNACLLSFPRFLQHLNIRSTHRITIDASHFLPSSLFDSSVPTSFYSSVFNINYGKAEPHRKFTHSLLKPL